MEEAVHVVLGIFLGAIPGNTIYDAVEDGGIALPRLVLFSFDDQPLIVPLQMGEADLAENDRGAFWTFMAIYFGPRSPQCREPGRHDQNGGGRSGLIPPNALDLFLVEASRQRVENRLNLPASRRKLGMTSGGSYAYATPDFCAMFVLLLDISGAGVATQRDLYPA